MAPVATCEPLPATCDPLDVDPARCVDTPGLVVPIEVDGHPAGARVDPTVVATLHLPPGTWHARLVDPADPCQSLVVSFDAEEAEPAAPRRAEGDAPPRGPSPPAWMATGGAP